VSADVTQRHSTVIKTTQSKSKTKKKSKSVSPSPKPKRKHRKHKPEETEEIVEEIEIIKRNIKLTITVLPKSGYPLSYLSSSPNALGFGGLSGKTLYVKRGYNYKITFTQPNPPTNGISQYLLFFTTDPIGGPPNANNQSIPGTPVFSSGTQVLHISKTFPKLSFYQDRHSPYIGGPIIVVD
jgi:hypothetical protein